MVGPLDDMRVLDMSRLLPGPFCSMLLAGMGAEVIKVEDPRMGDYMRWMEPFIQGESALFIAVNRNKKSIALDLKAEGGRDLFLRLAATADVILEGFRPGTMDRLGVGYEVVRQVNPGIVYCSLSGYGQDGPYRDRAGHDINYLALAGVLDITGGQDGPPVVPGVQVADLSGAMFAAIGILAALHGRERTGRGQYVDVSMMDGALSWLVAVAAEYFAEGETPERGKLRLSGGIPCYSIYRTRDGRHMSLGALEPKFWANFCQLVGREDLIPRQFDEGGAVHQELETVFASRSLEEWVALFEGQDVCCEPVRPLEEVCSDPHVRQRGMVVEWEHPRLGMLRQLGFPLRFSEAPAVVWNREPRMGEHTAGLMRALGYEESTIEQLNDAGVIKVGNNPLI